MKNGILLLLLFTFLYGCEKISEVNTELTENEDHKKTEINDSSQDAQGLVWLQSIFTCQTFPGKYCLPENEEEIFSERFYEFLLEGWEMQAGYNDTEFRKLEDKRQEKWGEIYPDLVKEEMMPFGRGQDVITSLYNLEIQTLGDLEYDVYVHHHGDNATQNVVRLVPVGDSFRIDYLETKSIPKKEIKKITYNFTQEWTWMYKNDHIEEMEIGHKGEMSLYYDPDSQNWLFNSKSFGGSGEMFKWLIGKPDGTYLSLSLPFEGEESTYDFWDAHLYPPYVTKLNEFYKTTGNSKTFNDNDWGFEKMDAKEYKRSYPKTNDFNMVYLADTEANFTAVYY